MAIELRKQKLCRLPVSFDPLIKAIAERKQISENDVLIQLLQPALNIQMSGGDPLPDLPDIGSELTELQ